MIQNINIPHFDLTKIHPGDCIRFECIGINLPQNGFIIRATEQEIKVCYSACTGNGMALARIHPDEVAAGKWRIWWTSDFEEIFTEGVGADGGIGL